MKIPLSLVNIYYENHTHIHILTQWFAAILCEIVEKHYKMGLYSADQKMV